MDTGQTPGQDTGGEDTGGGDAGAPDAPDAPDAECVYDYSPTSMCDGAECGDVSFVSPCGDTVVVECEMYGAPGCVDGDTCTQVNTCECLPAPGLSPDLVCEDVGAECGEAEAIDSCGAPFRVECGVCDLGLSCSENECEGTEFVSNEVETDGFFGTSLAIDAGRIAVGHMRFGRVASPGSVGVHEFTGERWARTAELVPRYENGFPDARQAFSLFGSIVEFEGNELFVGAPGRRKAGVASPSAVGGVYHYTFTGTGWDITQVVLPPDLDLESSLCGAAIELIGDTLFVGCPGGLYGQTGPLGPTRPGRVEVYRRGSVTQKFEHLTTLVSPAADDSTRDMFGFALARSKDGIAVGAPTALDSAGVDTGAVYVFEFDANGSFDAKETVTPVDLESGSAFGFSLAGIEGVYLAGAPSLDKNGDDKPDLRGAVYVFTGADSGGMRVTAPGGATGDAFGYDVAVRRSQILIGAPFFNEFGAAFGATFGPDMPPVLVPIVRNGSRAVGDRMGFAVDFDMTHGVASAPWADTVQGDDAFNEAGAVVVFPWMPEP